MIGGDGHYNPRGNRFFAYALKDRTLELLNPKPLPIRIEALTQSASADTYRARDQ